MTEIKSTPNQGTVKTQTPVAPTQHPGDESMEKQTADKQAANRQTDSRSQPADPGIISPANPRVPGSASPANPQPGQIVPAPGVAQPPPTITGQPAGLPGAPRATPGQPPVGRRGPEITENMKVNRTSPLETGEDLAVKGDPTAGRSE